MKRWRSIVAFAVLASACGGGDPGASGAATEESVESGEVLAALSVPSGSLPEGVSLDDVRVEVRVIESAVPGAPLMELRLLPDGLVLAEPATLTIALPDALDGGLMAIHVSGDSVEFLGGEIQQDGEGFSFRTSVRHFSFIEIYSGEPFFEVSVGLSPDQVLTGETQRADVTITRKPGRQKLWLRFAGSDVGPDFYRPVTFSTPERMYEDFNTSSADFEKRSIVWGAIRNWRPGRQQILSLSVTGTEEEGTAKWEGSASSKCFAPNVGLTSFVTNVFFGLTLLDLGEPEKKDWQEATDWLEGGDATRSSAPDSLLLGYTDEVKFLEMSSGDNFRAEVVMYGSTPTLCTAATTTTATTTTATTTTATPSTTTTSSTAPTGCEVAAGQPSRMTFSSPDVGPAIPRPFWFSSAYDLGFPTPAFEWEGVPEATTLLLITVQEINDDEADGIANGTYDLVADGWPTVVRWKATIPSNFTSLDRTWFTGGGEPDDAEVASHGDAANLFKDAARELPAGVVEWFHGSVIVQVGGEFVANKFAGPHGPGDVFLFTIFALCDPPEVVFDADNLDAGAYRPDWARPYAIDQAWFLASS